MATQGPGRSKGYPFFKPPTSYSQPKGWLENPAGTVVLLQQSLQKGTEVRAAIGATHDNARLRLASQAARVVVLDWQVAEERIHWDGATDILPFPLSNGHPQAFLDAVKEHKRSDVSDVENGHGSSICGHLANISFRVGRKVHWDAEKGQIKDDKEANKFLVPEYRAPWKLEIV